MHGGNKRQHIHSLGQPWNKSHGKTEGGDGERGTHSRGRGETAGAVGRGFRDAVMDMGDTQVGR